tara:strand:+ start:8340 stop:10097 length:1758 start_codon:yes stop_codon:yes gene_type:complete
MTKVQDDAFLNPYKERLTDIDAQNMYVPKAGFWEQVGAGFGEGIDYTSIALLSDLGMKARRSMNPLDAIEETDWNEQHPYWQDDIDWEPDLTLEVARNIYFERNESANYEKLSERGGGGGMVARGMGLFAGAMLDPVNLIAAPASMYIKAGLLGKMAMAGAANFVAEGALQTIAYNTQRERGEDYGIGDAALNLGFAAAVGAAFPVGGNVIGRLFRASKAGKMNGVIPEDNPSIKRDKYDSTTNQNVKFQSGQSGQSLIARIDNTNFNDVNTVNVATNGRVAKEGTVTVTNNKNGTVSVTGSNEDLLKVLPALSQRLDGFDNIVIKSKEGVEISTTAKDIQTAQQTLQKVAPEVKAELDQDISLQTREIEVGDKRYEIEIDEAGDVTGVVYTIKKNGKRGAKKKPKEAENIIKAHQKNQQTKTTQASEKAQTNNRQTDTAGRTTVDEKLNNKKHYNTTNQADATTGGRSADFRDNHSSPETATKAITAEQVTSRRTMFEAGYIVDDENNLIDLLETSLDDLPFDLRVKVARAMDLKTSQLKVKVTARGQKTRDMIEEFQRQNKLRQDDQTALEEYVMCMRGAGSI